MKLDLQLFAVPARRVSKTAKRARRTHLKKEAPTVVTCPNCGAPLMPHRACTKCGSYKGKEVLKSINELKVDDEIDIRFIDGFSRAKILEKGEK